MELSVLRVERRIAPQDFIRHGRVAVAIQTFLSELAASVPLGRAGRTRLRERRRARYRAIAR